MTTALALAAPAALADELAKLADRPHAHAADARTKSTRGVYRRHFKGFEAWSAAKGLGALPAYPATVVL